MSRGTKQKFKFTYLMKIMLAKTDDEHALTLSQIMDELEKYGVTAERKSLYTDFQDMTDNFGIEIIKEQIGRETYYHVGSREFKLAEVKLLVDAIQSSKFITQTKSRELINKVKQFVSEPQAKQLQRQVYINDRVKAMNESVYYNVDDIHTAINQNKKIKFKYYKWDVEKKLVPRHNGDWFIVSPWALTWDDENYYLVAFDDIDKQIKHYRVDKMMRISIEEDMRSGKDEFKNFDMAEYSKSTFGMYQGTKTIVKIEFANYMCGLLIFTGAADKEGSLGGLVEQGGMDKFIPLIIKAFENGLTCTTDPECFMKNPTSERLNGAACHSCTMISETACECGNRLLDRAFVVPIPEHEEMAYFRGLVNDLCGTQI